MINKEPIIIIGAGVGGLSAAIQLALRDHIVVVFEKNQNVGGLYTEERREGYRWDIGPVVLNCRQNLEEFFRSAGKRLEDYIQLVSVDPVWKFIFSDGKQIEIFRDLTRTIGSINSLGTNDVAGYLSFLAISAKYSRLSQQLYSGDLPTLLGSIKRIGFSTLVKEDLNRNLHQTINEKIKSSHLRQMLYYLSTNGVGLNRAPSILASNAYTNAVEGSWYLRGGNFQLIQALKRLAIEVGVKIKTSQPVREIVVQDREVRGVILDDGTPVENDIVIANLNVTSTYQNLLPSKPPYSWDYKKLSTRKLSPSVFTILWGVKDRHTNLAHQNVLMPSNIDHEISQLAINKDLPDDPVISVSITGKSDSSAAPMGHENWKVQVKVPNLGADLDWNEKSEHLKKIIIDRLLVYGCKLEGTILNERVLTPHDIQMINGSYQGSIGGSQMEDWRSPFLMPNPIVENPKGLYFIGNSVFPGSDLGKILDSGAHLADKLEKV